MRSAEETLACLARLHEADRQWILEQLPLATKARLAERVQSMASPLAPELGIDPMSEDAYASAKREMAWTNAHMRPASQSYDLAQARARIAATHEASVLAVLRHESPWLVSAILQLHDWPWRRRVIEGLPPTTRIEVMELQRTGRTFEGQAAERLLWLLDRKIQQNPAPDPKPSRFESVLARAIQKRMTR